MAAKYMASSLEEFDLFVPDDDDDWSLYGSASSMI